ncbi:MAG: hypothetical protein SP1CHLAM54_00010 [Chlamydiia bacterium]|nr:hypothetical protein [Chlamydiia bacterium]MCH9614927.1 hypothetical protein [Chlamydiia bacterium]MCH9629874.1 hypothetical protein [Chlamydiia bacterium]
MAFISGHLDSVLNKWLDRHPPDHHAGTHAKIATLLGSPLISYEKTSHPGGTIELKLTIQYHDRRTELEVELNRRATITFFQAKQGRHTLARFGH